MSALDRITTRYAHGFRTPSGDVGYFDLTPTHETKEAAEGCPSVILIEGITGLKDAGAIPIKTLKENSDVILRNGIPIPLPGSPFGTYVITSGPTFNTVMERMKAEGLPIPDAEDEAWVSKALEAYDAQAAQEAAGDVVPFPVPAQLH